MKAHFKIIKPQLKPIKPQLKQIKIQLKQMIHHIKLMILNQVGAPLIYGYLGFVVVFGVSLVDINGTIITIVITVGGEIDDRQHYMNQIV